MRVYAGPLGGNHLEVAAVVSKFDSSEFSRLF